MRPVCLVLILAAAGCVAAPIPRAQQVSAGQSIDDAQSAGAAGIEVARPHLEMAMEEQREGSRLMDAGAYREAELLFERAEADAQLALALAHEAPLTQKAQDALARAQQLRTQP